jgi:hypothetical protein
VTTQFGEFDQVHIVEGFCLPLPDQNEWILAEDGDNEEDGDYPEDGIMGGMAIPTSSQMMESSNTTTLVFQPPEEETWVPFDPNDEEEEDAEVHGSLVSDVEVVRAADESFLSGDQVSKAKPSLA